MPLNLPIANGSCGASHATRRGLWPYLFIAPFVLLFFLFNLYPLARSLWLSFCSTRGSADVHFVALANYRHLLHDPYFWLATANTAVYVIVFLLLQTPLSLGLAMLLNHPRLPQRNLLRLMFFSTHAVGQVFVAIIFAQLLSPGRGWLGHMPWLTHSIMARCAVLLAWLWLSVGYGMVYLLAALQTIDREILDAARVDGAGVWARFRHVTLPAIAPALSFLILVGMVSGFQLFELPYVLLQGPGPGFSGLTLVMYLFSAGFEAGNLGYASAIGWLLVLLLALLSVVHLRLSGRASMMN